VEEMDDVKPLDNMDTYVKLKRQTLKGELDTVDKKMLSYHRIRKGEEEKQVLIVRRIIDVLNNISTHII
jgi:hypothetical protein